MFTANETQRTYLKLSVENDLRRQVDSFVLDRRTRGLAAGTIRFYHQKLNLFLAYCEEQVVSTVSQIDPTLVRRSFCG